jgi:orotidine-5'-phosphate decarboxylase
VILDHIADENEGAEPLGSVGAVVGATLDEAGVDLGINGPLLAPGLGAQGATAADLRRVFGSAVRDVVPSVSRGVLKHGPSVDALRAAAVREAGELAAVIG